MFPISNKSKRREPSTGEARADETKPITKENMTTTHTHTNGPWCIHRGYTNPETMTITDDNGESWEFTHTYIGQGEKIIAQVQHQSKDSGWPHVHDVNEMWANARLIASAPELLAALKGLLEVTEENYDNRHEVEAALYAISKAEGRDS